MMNILPIIFSLLLVLGISSSSLLEKRKDSRRFIASYNKLHDIQRSIQIKTTNEGLAKLRKQENEKTEDAPKKKLADNKSNKHRRIASTSPTEKKIKRHRCAKLNLYPLLFMENPEESLRYKIFVDFIAKHYKHSNIFNNLDCEKTTKNLLDRMISSAKITAEKKEPLYLEKLSLGSSSLQRVFYQLLKGSPHYNNKNKQEFPSILDFVSLDADEYKTMCFKHTSKKMLSVLFDDKISADIFEAYLEHPVISQKLLNEILTNNNSSLEEETKKLLNFTHVDSTKIDSTRIFAQDKDQQMKASVDRYLNFQ